MLMLAIILLTPLTQRARRLGRIGDRPGDQYPGMREPYKPGTPDLGGFWFDLLFGSPNPPPRSSDPNLCGSGSSEKWVPDYIGSLDLRPACQRHDDCYGTYGQPKGRCDFNLTLDILG